MNPQLKEWVKGNGSAVKKENFTIYELKVNVKHEDLENKVRVVTVGPENDLETKTVLLLGETGVGKTTFLNTFLNMVFGVGLEDELRLQFKDQMDQAKDSTQSQYTTAFTIYRQEGMPQPFNYMVIDTPGLGDTEGDQKDKVNEKCLRFYLTNEAWIKHLNCVGLVWKAPNRRLDEHNQAVLSKMNNFLGFDIKAITDVLFTFSGTEDPAAVQIIEAAGIEYKNAFHFENMPLYNCPAEGMGAFHALTWEAMAYNHSQFLDELNQRQPQELKITARLLLAQAKLEEVQMRVNALGESLALTSDQLQSHQVKMSDLEAKAAKVDWDKTEHLQSEEIVLDGGRHCHFCNLCQSVCVKECTDDHQTAKDHSDMDDCAEVQGAEGSLMLVQEAVETNSPGIFSSMLPCSIRSLMNYFGSEDKTLSLHSNEGSQRCSVCQHVVLKHEIRNKILVKDANSKQKMELLKKMKYKGVAGEKSLLQSKIEEILAEQKKFEKQNEEELKVLEEMQKEVKRLQTGHW